MRVSAVEHGGKLITAWSASAADTMVGPGGKRGWLHVFTAGEWKGHPIGPFDLTGAAFDQMIANFERQKTPLSIDYDHSLPERGDSRAAGWIRRLEKRVGNDGPELWAEVEWTPAAARMIGDGEYKNCSGYFSLESTDRVSGEPIGAELFNVGLTNNPFIDGLTPIQLSRAPGRDAIAAMAIQDAARTLAAPPPPPKAKDDEDEPQDAPAEGDAPPAEPAPAEGQPPTPPPGTAPGDTPEGDQQKLIATQLTTAIDQMCETAGIERIEAVEMLAVLADQIGGQMREMKERDQTPAEERAMSATTTDPKSATPPANDEQRIAAAAVRAAEATNEILLSRIEKLTQRLDERDAADKATKDAANAKRISAMFEAGALVEDEREEATWMLSEHPDRFEKIYGKREGLGKPVPIGVSQAGRAVTASRTPAPAGIEFPAEIAGSEHDENVYAFCLKQGMSAERALARTLANRNKQTARRAAKVG